MTFKTADFTRRPSNMYPLSIKQWNPHVGCKHHCKYCVPSFQRALKRFSKCDQCKGFTPHTHPERLDQKLPRTRYMQFIFTNSSGDSAFCEDNYFYEILEKIENNKDKNFLIQSKDPRKAFLDRDVGFPKNLILGTTIETNLTRLTNDISKAPPPEERFKAMLELRELKYKPKTTLMLTIEPILAFEHKVMIDWIEQINPCMIWIGYDSKKCGLVEPALMETWMLAQDLFKRGYVVILKLMRKAWWENSVRA